MVFPFRDPHVAPPDWVKWKMGPTLLGLPLQNVPVRPPIAQSTPLFFCTFLRISQKISISQRLRAGCSLDTEGIGRKSQAKEESRFCTEVAVGEPIGRLRFVLSSRLPLRLTNRWPVPQEPYRQEPFLVDEDGIGGSAIEKKMRTTPPHCNQKRDRHQKKGKRHSPL